MKQRLKDLVMGALVTVMVFGTVTAFAATPQTIEVVFGNVRTTLFGHEFIVRNEQGVIIEPFTYNGMVYVPVDVISHAIGANVQWDESSRTLNFGAVNQPPVVRYRVPLQTAAPFFDSGRTGFHDNRDYGDVQTPNNRESIQIGGTPHYNTIVYRSSRRRARNSTIYDNGVFTLHNLNGQYNRFSGYIGRVDGSSMYDATVEIRGDGRLLQTLYLNAADMPIPFSLSVEGVTQLRVDVIFTRLIDHRTEYALVGFLE